MKKHLIFILALVSLAACNKPKTQNGTETATTTQATVPAAATGKVEGVVTVAPALAKEVKDTDVLFIIARAQQAGPPSAVKRIANPKFPLKFVIGAEDAMMPGIPGFEDGTPLTLAARLSKTGDAMPARGDLEGVFPENPIKMKANDTVRADITISQVRQ